MPPDSAASSIVVLVVGLAVCAAGIAAVVLRLRRQEPPAVLGDSSWLQVAGKIVDFEPVPGAGVPRWRPIYAFTPPDQARVQGKSEGDDYAPDRRSLGQHRTIAFNPTNPRQFQVGPAPASDIGLYAGIALVSIGAATVVAWAMA